jgi:hypothetical protein
MQRAQDDNSHNVRPPARSAMTGSVPAGLRYDVGVVEGISATRSMRRFYSSTGGTFSPANPTIRVDVVSPNHLDLNSALLYFKLTNGAAEVINVDGGAACCIERLRVLSSQGQVIESIERFNVWNNIISQFAETQEEANAQSILSQAPSNKLDNTTSGQWAAGASHVVAVPIKSAFFQNASSKYLPAQCGFTLEMTLAAADACFVSQTGATYTVSNVYLEVPDIAIHDPGYHSNILAYAMANDGMLSWSGVTAKTSISSLQGQGSHTIHINDRSRSLRAMMSVFRDNATINTSTIYALSAKSIAMLAQWDYEIGGRPCPAQAVDVTVPGETAATYAQLMRVWASTGSMNVGLISRAAFDGGYAAAGAVSMIGVALESYEDGSLYSGIDTATSGLPVSLRLQTSAAIAATTVEALTFALCDIEFTFNIVTGELTASI